MSYAKPFPNIDPEIKPFWDGLKEHKFLLFRCRTCSAWYWPAAYCRNHPNEPFMGEMAWEPASGRGKVFAFNVHHVAFIPSFQDDLPFVFALIELEEGPMFGTNIVGTPAESVKIGAQTQIVFEDHPEEGFTLPKARIVSESSGVPGVSGVSGEASP